MPSVLTTTAETLSGASPAAPAPRFPARYDRLRRGQPSGRSV